MSRLAKKTIPIPEGVTVEEKNNTLHFKGVKGETELKILDRVKVQIAPPNIKVEAEAGDKQARANVGTTWSLIQNQIEGVNSGFSKILEIEGVGFRASMEGKILVLSLGFVNPVKFTPPEGINIAVEKNVITVIGADKAKVGQAAAQIRGFKEPEPYKGKGIHYRGEIIRRKVGKKAGVTAE
jgi:large subunit ribosomal protein L6